MSINKKWNSCEIDHYKSVSKIQDHLRRESAAYLFRHPEVRAMVRTLLHEAVNKPKTKPAELAASLFDCNLNVMLKPKIDEELKFVLNEMRKSNWDKYDSETLIKKSDSTQSLLSSSSLISDMESILRFCIILPRDS